MLWWTNTYFFISVGMLEECTPKWIYITHYYTVNKLIAIFTFDEKINCSSVKKLTKIPQWIWNYYFCGRCIAFRGDDISCYFSGSSVWPHVCLLNHAFVYSYLYVLEVVCICDPLCLNYWCFNLIIVVYISVTPLDVFQNCVNIISMYIILVSL